MSEYLMECEKTITLDDGTALFFRPELSTDTEMLWEMVLHLVKKVCAFSLFPSPESELNDGLVT